MAEDSDVDLFGENVDSEDNDDESEAPRSPEIGIQGRSPPNTTLSKVYKRRAQLYTPSSSESDNGELSDKESGPTAAIGDELKDMKVLLQKLFKKVENN